MFENIVPLRLYNQDVIPKTWGLWRWSAGGVITAEEYKYDTRTLGPYTFEEFYGWHQYYYSSKPAPPTKLLYKYLLESNEALACIFVNNSYVARIRSDSIEYVDLDDPTSVSIQYYDEEISGVKYLMNIGYVKTPVQCYVVPMRPWKLEYDIEKQQAYLPKKGWVTLKCVPKVQFNMEFSEYKKLLGMDNANAVYQSLDTDDILYI